jgi:hypothetical protein
MSRSPTSATGRLAGLIGTAAMVCLACGTDDTNLRPSTAPSGGEPPAASAASTPPSAPASTAPSDQPTVGPSGSPSPAPFARNPAKIVEGRPYRQAIDPANFVATIDNPFFPLAPGTKWTYGGDEKVVVTVTPDTKPILGVAATVVRDQVFVGGKLEEDTFDWFAQDVQGNVWYFGEQTAEYTNGKISSRKGSWTAGVDGAQPGIVMLAQPRAGDAYRQEYLVGEAEDLAKVTALSGKVTVPAGSYNDVLVTEEWTPLEPGFRERKTYARGVGLVDSRSIKGGSQVVQLEAVKSAG